MITPRFFIVGNGKKKNGNGGGGGEKPIAPNSAVKRNPDGTFAVGSAPMSPFPKGVSGNPGGKPRIIRDTWAEWLAEPNPQQPAKTNARVGVEAVGANFLRGDVPSAREARSAVEGTQVNVSYQNEVVLWLQQGLISVQDVLEDLDPEEARVVLLAAGVQMPAQPAEAQGEGVIVDGESQVIE